MNLERFPSSESAKRMLSYVSHGFYNQSYVGKWLFEVLGREIDDARERIEELALQAFPETATWGLRYHEEKFGLPVRGDLTDEERRKEIFQRRDMRTSMTPYAMERLLKNVTDFQVHVADINDVSIYIPKVLHPNTFDVVLIGDGTAAIANIKALINRVKQSHTTFNLFYYDYVKYEVPIHYDNAIHFQTSFHPHYNLPFLQLDRLWKLDNSRRLNGYDSGDVLDFYPVGIRIQSDVNADIRAGQRIQTIWANPVDVETENALHLKTEAGQKIRSAEQIKIRTSAAESPENHSELEYVAETKHNLQPGESIRYQSHAAGEVQSQEQFTIRNEAAQGIDTASYMTKMNQMNKEWKLDGSRKLDGGRYIL